MVRARTYNPYKRDPHVPVVASTGRPAIRYSLLEILHISAAVAALTAAATFTIPVALPDIDLSLGALILSCFAAVVSGFLLHELAHKIIAQYYGHWAEFRAFMPQLGLTVLIAAFLKFLIAAPGAVMISGSVTRKENGIISLAGPGTNLIIAGATFPLFGIGVVQPAPWQQGLMVIAHVNALLGLFNLVPFGPLDGKKVMTWSRTVWLISVALAILVFVMVQGWLL